MPKRLRRIQIPFEQIWKLSPLTIGICYLIMAVVSSLLYWLWSGLKAPEGENLDWSSYIYFSFIAQSTVGFGDISPVGLGRLIAAVQGVTGNGLIAFLFFKLGGKNQEDRALIAEVSKFREQRKELVRFQHIDFALSPSTLEKKEQFVYHLADHLDRQSAIILDQIFDAQTLDFSEKARNLTINPLEDLREKSSELSSFASSLSFIKAESLPKGKSSQDDAREHRYREKIYQQKLETEFPILFKQWKQLVTNAHKIETKMRAVVGG